MIPVNNRRRRRRRGRGGYVIETFGETEI